MESESQEYSERKAILEFEMRMNRERHENKMEELAFARESDKLHHEMELTRMRIKTAEIRKTVESNRRMK